MSQINSKNANTEMSKRIKLTKKMLDEGKTVIQIANFFGLSVDTIKKYITHIRIAKDDVNLNNFETATSNDEIVKKKPKQKKLVSQRVDTTNISSLNAQPQRTLSKGEEFIEMDERKGHTCRACSTYFTFNNLVKWKENLYICKKCFPKMDIKKLKKLVDG